MSALAKPSGAAFNYRISVWSREMTRRALRWGWLTKPSHCEECGDPGRIETHHIDYARPFDVMFLCARCHAGVHARLRSLGVSGERVSTAYMKKINGRWRAAPIEAAE